MLKSRKFWATLAAVSAAVSGALTGEINWSLAIETIVVSLGAYVIGAGLEKSGKATP